MAFKMGYDYKKMRNKDKIKKIFPFSSEEKKMATFYEDDSSKAKKLLCFVKGGPDFLLSYCSSYINAEGGISRINEDFSARINQVIE